MRAPRVIGLRRRGWRRRRWRSTPPASAAIADGGTAARRGSSGGPRLSPVFAFSSLWSAAAFAAAFFPFSSVSPFMGTGMGEPLECGNWLPLWVFFFSSSLHEPKRREKVTKAAMNCRTPKAAAEAVAPPSEGKKAQRAKKAAAKAPRTPKPPGAIEIPRRAQHHGHLVRLPQPLRRPRQPPRQAL